MPKLQRRLLKTNGGQKGCQNFTFTIIIVKIKTKKIIIRTTMHIDADRTITFDGSKTDLIKAITFTVVMHTFEEINGVGHLTKEDDKLYTKAISYIDKYEAWGLK